MKGSQLVNLSTVSTISFSLFVRNQICRAEILQILKLSLFFLVTEILNCFAGLRKFDYKKKSSLTENNALGCRPSSFKVNCVLKSAETGVCYLLNN